MTNIITEIKLEESRDIIKERHELYCNQLGPPELVISSRIYEKTNILQNLFKQEGIQNNEPNRFYHYVLGMDVNTPMSVCVYVKQLIDEIEKERSMFSYSEKLTQANVYVYNALSRVDLQVTYTIPGCVKVFGHFLQKERIEKRELEGEELLKLFKEAFWCSLIRYTKYTKGLGKQNSAIRIISPYKWMKTKTDVGEEIGKLIREKGEQTGIFENGMTPSPYFNEFVCGITHYYSQHYRFNHLEHILLPLINEEPCYGVHLADMLTYQHQYDKALEMIEKLSHHVDMDDIQRMSCIQYYRCKIISKKYETLDKNRIFKENSILNAIESPTLIINKPMELNDEQKKEIEEGIIDAKELTRMHPNFRFGWYYLAYLNIFLKNYKISMKAINSIPYIESIYGVCEKPPKRYDHFNIKSPKWLHIEKSNYVPLKENVVIDSPFGWTRKLKGHFMLQSIKDTYLLLHKMCRQMTWDDFMKIRSDCFIMQADLEENQQEVFHHHFSEIYLIVEGVTGENESNQLTKYLESLDSVRSVAIDMDTKLVSIITSLSVEAIIHEIGSINSSFKSSVHKFKTEVVPESKAESAAPLYIFSVPGLSEKDEFTNDEFHVIEKNQMMKTITIESSSLDEHELTKILGDLYDDITLLEVKEPSINSDSVQFEKSSPEIPLVAVQNQETKEGDKVFLTPYINTLFYCLHEDLEGIYNLCNTKDFSDFTSIELAFCGLLFDRHAHYHGAHFFFNGSASYYYNTKSRLHILEYYLTQLLVMHQNDQQYLAIEMEENEEEEVDSMETLSDQLHKMMLNIKEPSSVDYSMLPQKYVLVLQPLISTFENICEGYTRMNTGKIPFSKFIHDVHPDVIQKLCFMVSTFGLQAVRNWISQFGEKEQYNQFLQDVLFQLVGWNTNGFDQ